uniref:26S proteasome regulatory subunit N5 n=1 Tax=Tetraselmis sp. GSL018 TaxID=582737 RepID=A0A061QT58_9CHLO|mmetsp:Transcript_28766/g.68652  ORF Transcript_28766/g.68652 Transcript_28766/m.68652 type:complete len:490 (+) Transcript_28766:111-1580(+)|eukprot:CAMPEP_0177618998 /NCGR_PEP_ID=MMETSP0419_2-20121207/25979_1 /TAXON_ID=582737 /ORGANISM="Tetraselmis sp., Strain GSL018" /LENGTH=489 /DNA_ID=CAMNT_0019118143 /DNA_START=98 /DNA_END=1567 /DNA_ORIENTATION=+
MVENEFNASSIATEEDKREEKNRSKKNVQVDYKALEAEIEANKSLMTSKGSFSEALENLLNLEKVHRLAEDSQATKMCCQAILEACFNAKDWKLLNEHIILLAKRRAQLKQVVQAFVRQAMGYLEHTPDTQTKTELIKTLQTVTEGKIFVEIERARLTRQLARMKEDAGEVSEAAEVMQEVAVETFGAMSKVEKIAFILDQVRLCLDCKDYMRALILSKKVSPRAFRDTAKKDDTGEIGIEGTAIEPPAEGTPDLETLKLRYYELMIRYHAHAENYLEICRSYKAIFETKSIQDDPDKWMPVLKSIVWYVVLASHGTEQVTLLNNTMGEKKLEDLPAYKKLLTTFVTKEVVGWTSLQQEYKAEMEANADVFGGENGPKRAEDFRLRVVEHNVLVIAGYYSRVRMSRLAELLDLPTEEAEKRLSDMVVSKVLHARIDRPAGYVRFNSKVEPSEILNSWSRNMCKLLNLVEKSCQQIQKEAMQHKVHIGSS